MKIVKILFALIFSFIGGALIASATGVPEHALLGGVIVSALSLTIQMPTDFAYAGFFSGEPITFIPKQASEAIIEPAFERPNISELFTVYEDIVAEEHIPFVGRIDKIIKKDLGCGTGKGEKAIPLSEVIWTPKRQKIWLGQCADDLDRIFFVWGKKKGVEERDLNGTLYMQFVMEIISDAANIDTLRIALLGDEAADDNASGGTLFDAANIPYYNNVNGLFKKLFAISGARLYTINANASATYDLQDSDLLANEAYLMLKALVTKCDPRLKASASREIWMTQSLFDNWIAWKESQAGIDRSFERQEQGFQMDTFRGISIRAVETVDRYVRADFNDGTKYYRPHRAVIMDKAYLALGFDASSAISKFKVWLNDDTEEMNMKGGFKIDFKILRDYMVGGAW